MQTKGYLPNHIAHHAQNFIKCRFSKFFNTKICHYIVTGSSGIADSLNVKVVHYPVKHMASAQLLIITQYFYGETLHYIIIGNLNNSGKIMYRRTLHSNTKFGTLGPAICILYNKEGNGRGLNHLCNTCSASNRISFSRFLHTRIKSTKINKP